MRKLLILHSPNNNGFPTRIADEFKKMGGFAAVRAWTDLMPLSTDYKIAGYDVLHVRFGGRGDGDNVLELLGDIARKSNLTAINRPETHQLTSNKYKAIIYASAVMRVPKTLLLNLTYDSVDSILDELEPPFFIKPIFSSQGKNIVLINHSSELSQCLSGLSGTCLVQEAVDFEKLIRVVYVGKVVDAAYCIPSTKYSASVCKNSELAKYDISQELRNKIKGLAERFGQEIMVVDLFYEGREFVFNEINSACNLDYMMKSTGINYAKLIAEYLNKNS